MKFLPLLLAFLPALPSPLRAEIALQGVACTLPFAHFALIDSLSGDRRWISLGDVFACFTAHDYDPARETLTLGKNGATIRLGLSRSSSRPVLPPPSAPSSAAVSNDPERDYWLATVRDEQAGGFMQRLHGEIKSRLALARDLETAAAAFAQNPSHENAQRLADAKRNQGTVIQAETFLWTRAVEPAASR